MSGAPKPRVRGSKNRKKAWKKCDISEVEEFLEEKRFDERIGGPVSEKSNDDLFQLQTTAEDVPSRLKKKVGVTWRYHSDLDAFSKVDCPILINLERYSKKILARQLNADKKREKRAKANAIKENKKNEENVLRGDLFASEMKDLWGEDEKLDPEVKDLILYRDEITRKRMPKVPCHRYQKPSLLPPVEIPHPGASYNPSYEDHQELLSEALKIEEVKEREELHIKRVLTDMFPTRSEAPTAQSVLLEMSQGLFDEGNEEENETEQPALSQYRNPPVTPDNRIPKSRKRRKKERKEEERLKKIEKLRKLQMNKIYNLRGLKKEIKHEEEISEQRQDERQQRKIDKMYKPLVLSKHKYEAPDVELALSNELCDSLRTLKAEGNLLEDRYKSLQRRNLIEPRIKQKMKRKYKLKRQVKRSHRDFK